MDCAASCSDTTGHQAWVIDRASVQYPRRAAFETNDADLETMRELLTDGNEKNARGFEAAVSWLLWMLGFNPVHLRDSKRHEEAPDLIVDCEGQFAIVECTIGQLKDDKLAKLTARFVEVRDGLEVSGHGEAKLLPILVTRHTREQVQSDLDKVTFAGVHVLTRDELALLLERTRLRNEPRLLLDEWRRQAASAKAALARRSTPGY